MTTNQEYANLWLYRESNGDDCGCCSKLMLWTKWNFEATEDNGYV